MAGLDKFAGVEAVAQSRGWPEAAEDGMTPTGFEQTSNSPQNRKGAPSHSAPDSAFSADLRRIIEAWPALPADRKAAMLAILDNSPSRSGS
jgi:hypothetical protein